MAESNSSESNNTDDFDVVAGGTGRSASTLELFFDLVYVFAITQVVGFIHHDPTVAGLAKGSLLLLIMWWTWTIYTWTTNWTGTASNPIKLFLLSTMGASLVMATAVQGAFSTSAPLFGATLFVVRILAAGLYWVASKKFPLQRAAFFTFFPLSFLAASVFLIGGFLPGSWVLGAFLVGTAVDLVSAANAGRGKWAVDASHFAERNGLFVIIALGESVVGVGLTAVGVTLDAPHMIALIISFLGIGGLWWAYFDGAAPHLERHLSDLSGQARGRFARDAYSLLHYPLVVGIVVFAVGLEDVVAHPTDHIELIDRVAVGGAIALALLSIAGGAYRAIRLVLWDKLAASALLIGMVWIGDGLSGVTFAGVAVAVLAISLVWGRIRAAAHRAASRARSLRSNAPATTDV